MKSLHWLALAACLSPVTATATTVSHPLTADVYRELLRFRTQPETAHAVPFGDAVLGTPGALKQLLQDPSSPYSERVDRPAFTNELWWEDFTYRMDPASGFSSVLDTLQWQFGLTKARPGMEVELTKTAASDFLGREAAANAIKAGVHPRIFMKAWDMNSSHITIAAQDALALQLLYEQMRNTPREKWGAHAIRPDVFRRYMKARSPDVISEADTRYLAALVTSALRSNGMSQGVNGVQQLPAAFRIARVAAAYKDARGYYNGRAYCVGDAPRSDLPKGPEALDDHAPLCFIAATDRAVLAWYREEARLELSGVRIHENQHTTWDKILYLFGVILPALDIAAFMELTEASVAHELAESAAIDAEEANAAAIRTERLICGVDA